MKTGWMHTKDETGQDVAFSPKIAIESIEGLDGIIAQAILASDKRKWPVGALYLSTADTDPAILLGFGTWEPWGAERVPVGVGGKYDKAGMVGGSDTHSHTVASHTHGVLSHTHTVASHTHTTGSFTLLATHLPEVNIGIGGTQLSWNKTTGGSQTRVNLQGTYGGNFTGGYEGTSVGTGGLAHNHGNTGGTPLTTLGTELTTLGTAPATNPGDNRQPYITCYMFKRTA